MLFKEQLDIDGILATPRVSRNKNFYFPEELARGNMMVVPLRWEHIKSMNGIVGESRLKWDDDLMQLKYVATITNPEAEAAVRKAQAEGHSFRTSLGITSNDKQKICHKAGECYIAPIDINFDEMSIVMDAGIPESTINFTESMETRFYDETKKMFKIRNNDDINHLNTSNEGGNITNKVMSETKTTEDTTVQVKTVPETPVPAPVVTPTVATTPAPAPVAPAPVAPAPVEPTPEPVPAPVPVAPVATAPTPAVEGEKEAQHPCPAGCVPSSSDKPAAPPSGEKKECGCSTEKLVNDKVSVEIEKLQKTIRETYEPKAEVTESVSNAQETEESINRQADLMKEVLEGKCISIKLDKEEFIKSHTATIKSPFSEAVSTSGTISGVFLGTDIVILKGGIKVKPIRQWLQVKQIPQGDDTVRFYTLDIPAFGDITESFDTDISPATTTLTGIDVLANTVRGFRQNVLKSELERYPKQLLEKIRETARIRAIEDEAANTLITIAASDSVDFGANHLGFSNGTTVADIAAEDALTEATGAGIEAAKQRLEEQGHDPENGAAVCALTPRQMKNLATDSDLIRYVQQGDPSISRQGRMAMYFGVELWVTNTIRTTNNASRAILFMKGDTFGLAVGRELELEFDKNINRQSVDIVATHRVNSVILDATAYVILSSVQA